MSKVKRLLDEYHFPGFRSKAKVKGIFGDPKARVITLVRRQKKQCAAVAAHHTQPSTTEKFVVFETSLVLIRGYILRWRFAECDVESVAK